MADRIEVVDHAGRVRALLRTDDPQVEQVREQGLVARYRADTTLAFWGGSVLAGLGGLFVGAAWDAPWTVGIGCGFLYLSAGVLLSGAVQRLRGA